MKRILVVEDGTGIAFGLRVDLTTEGYEVEVQTDGERALERARNGGFDLILLDVMLPGKQGTAPITDVSLLHGDFWPEEESIEEFLATRHEWRGHKRSGPLFGHDKDMPANQAAHRLPFVIEQHREEDGR